MADEANDYIGVQESYQNASTKTGEPIYADDKERDQYALFGTSYAKVATEEEPEAVLVERTDYYGADRDKDQLKDADKVGEKVAEPKKQSSQPKLPGA